VSSKNFKKKLVFCKINDCQLGLIYNIHIEFVAINDCFELGSGWKSLVKAAGFEIPCEV
jgi:hypothetical protein